MSSLKFVIQSNFGGPNEGQDENQKPKRAKHACHACQLRKVKCSGVMPCKLCKTKNIECEFKDSKSGSGSGGTSGSSNITQDSRNPAPTNSSLKRKAMVQNGSINNASNGPRKRYKLQTTRQPYFRWLGPTAIAPPQSGTYRLLSVNLRSNELTNDRKAIMVERQPISLERSLFDNSNDSTNVNNNSNNNNIPRNSSTSSGSTFASSKSSPESTASDFDNFPPLPPKEVFRNFSENMSNFLPYMTIEGFEDGVSQGIISECLLYSMASISERLNPKSTATPTPSGDITPVGTPNMAERYLEAAKRLVIPHLASPSVEIVYGLLLIAYSEFAEDRDSGLWAWSGMAIRMCYDLGLHKVSAADDAEAKVGRKVFWSVVCLDRLISCGTGRGASIPDSDIEHEPEHGEIVTNDGQRRSDPFPYLCKLLVLLGQVSNYLNTHATNNMTPNKTLFDDKSVSPSSLSPESWDQMEAFAKFQQQVSDFYTTLPPDLLFDVQNFQEFSKLKHSQVFLLLHIWNQALVLAVHHPTIVYPKAQLDVMGLMSNPHADLTGTGSISIADMISFADLIDANSFLANPFLSQPIYMAACAALTLSLSLPQSSASHKFYTLQRTFNTCRQMLTRMQRIWRGISWHSRTLDSLAASESDVDLSVNSKGFVNTKDLGLVRKATIDESTRKWLAEEIGDSNNDEIYGLFVSGITENQQPLHQPQPLQGRNNSNSTATNNNNTDDTTSISSSDILEQPPNEPRQRPHNYRSTTDNRPDESFRSMVMRNMDLDEYLRPF